jgi:putative ABC transport system permease protein
MTMVTRQNLMAEKTRFLISVGGIALAVLLMSFLLSLYQGWRLNVGRFVEHVDADVWVAREGTSDFLNAASILPLDMRAELEALPNVERVDALIVRPMDAKVDGTLQTTHLVGYEVGEGAGGPPSHKSGSEEPGTNEVIVDSAFKKKAGVNIGDEVSFSGHTLKIAGVSGGGNLIFSQVSFVPIETAQDVLSMPTFYTFYLLHVSGDPDDVADQVEQSMPGVGAFTGDEFSNATRDRIMKNLLPILIVIIILAFVVGVAITGLTIYNATVEKSKEFGILKALGFTNGYLFRLVLEQSMATGLLGFAIGAGLTALAAPFVASAVPQFVTLLRWQDILFVFVATILMSTISAFLPVRRIGSVDPVSVFSG